MMEVRRNVSSVFLRGCADIRSVEIFFLEKPKSLWSRITSRKFHGAHVLFSRKLDERELAPISKMLSIRDIFLGRPQAKSPPSVGMRMNVGRDQIDVLTDAPECWIEVIAQGERVLLPLDRHAAFVMGEFFSHIRHKGANPRCAGTLPSTLPVPHAAAPCPA